MERREGQQPVERQFTKEQSDALWLCYSLLMRLAASKPEQPEAVEVEQSEADVETQPQEIVVFDARTSV